MKKNVCSHCMADDTHHFNLTFTKNLVCSRHSTLMKIMANIYWVLTLCWTLSWKLNNSFIPHFNVMQQALLLSPFYRRRNLSTWRLGNFPKDTQLVNHTASTLVTLLMRITSQERQTYKQMFISQCDKCQDIQSAKRTQIHKFCWRLGVWA